MTEYEKLMGGRERDSLGHVIARSKGIQHNDMLTVIWLPTGDPVNWELVYRGIAATVPDPVNCSMLSMVEAVDLNNDKKPDLWRGTKVAVIEPLPHLINEFKNNVKRWQAISMMTDMVTYEQMMAAMAAKNKEEAVC